MNCHDFQHKLALLVGEELEVSEAIAARRHTAQCPACREVLKGLTDSRTVMRVVSETPTEFNEGSLWPRLRAQLMPATIVQPRRGYPSWLPTATLAAACVALLIFVGSTPMLDGQSETVTFVDPSFGVKLGESGNRPSYPFRDDGRRGGIATGPSSHSVGLGTQYSPHQQVYHGTVFGPNGEL